jgi:predicted short-subunit dehydrogenase-like oxidoreductase (DUF2520 family)
MRPFTNISIIGAGNVGWHLGRALAAAGQPVVQVFSRQGSKARELAAQIGAQPLDDLALISASADLYILAVSDDAIGPTVEALSRYLPAEKAVVHTSGSTPTEVLEPFFLRCGVFYPLQTFSREREIDFSSTPICVYSSNPSLEAQLQGLGGAISSSVHRIDDEQRAVLHLAAVFVNNFTNHLFQLGQQIVQGEGIPFDLLRPLILETARKVQDADPAAMQTGPARRGDQETIRRHLDYLQKFPKLANVYEIMTRGIGGDES